LFYIVAMVGKISIFRGIFSSRVDIRKLEYEEKQEMKKELEKMRDEEEQQRKAMLERMKEKLDIQYEPGKFLEDTEVIYKVR